jgi:hypothetical protein
MGPIFVFTVGTLKSHDNFMGENIGLLLEIAYVCSSGMGVARMFDFKYSERRVAYACCLLKIA